MNIESGFYALSGLAFAAVIALLRNGDHAKKLIAYYIMAGSIWIVYTIAIAKTGVLNDFSLPPRVPLFIVIPSVITIVFITGRPSFRTVLEKTPLALPVFLISFRILVELLIYGAYRNGVFPQRVTFEGLNFDGLVGLSSLIVGVLLVKKMFSLQALLTWNIVSLAVLGLTVYSFVSAYYFTDYVASTGNNEFVSFPYLLIASVLLPIALFLHVFSIRQIVVFRKARGAQVPASGML